jgi:transcription elongation factor GreA
MNKEYYLTKQGLENVKREYEELKKLQKNEIMEQAPAMLEGDALNPDYSFYLENIEELEKRIEELEMIIKHYSIIKKPPKKDQEMVCIGASLGLKDDSGKTLEFKIVGTFEANPFEGRISNESPAGQAALGKRVGDKVAVNGGPLYKITKIQYEES